MSNSILDADLNALLRQGYAELETALGEENVAERQLAFCQSKVARLTAKIIQLAIASDDPKLIGAVKETGLTDALRTVLRAAERPLSAPEIRKRLEEIGFDVASYQNFLATLYLTLERLKKQGEVNQEKHAGKKVYVRRISMPENPFKASFGKQLSTVPTEEEAAERVRRISKKPWPTKKD
jgi:cob(I)alamin adenosyltransferase